MYEAVLIRSGLSKNNRFLSRCRVARGRVAVRGSADLRQGRRAAPKGEGKDVRNIVGYVADAKFVEGKTADTGYPVGTVTFFSLRRHAA